MGGVCSRGRVHEPKVVHEVKGDHTVIPQKHDRHHPNGVQQMLTATDDVEEKGITTPVISSGHHAKKHFHIDGNGHAHHSFVARKEGTRQREDPRRRESVDEVALARARKAVTQGDSPLSASNKSLGSQKSSGRINSGYSPRTAVARHGHSRVRRPSLPLFFNPDAVADDELAKAGTLAMAMVRVRSTA